MHLYDVGHMTKMVAMSIDSKNPLKIFLPRNQWADFRETWYVHVALRTPAHHSLLK